MEASFLRLFLAEQAQSATDTTRNACDGQRGCYRLTFSRFKDVCVRCCRLKSTLCSTYAPPNGKRRKRNGKRQTLQKLSDTTEPLPTLLSAEEAEGEE
eukprot:19923-Rhodomonas_salina.1